MTYSNTVFTINFTNPVPDGVAIVNNAFGEGDQWITGISDTKIEVSVQENGFNQTSSNWHIVIF